MDVYTYLPTDSRIKHTKSGEKKLRDVINMETSAKDIGWICFGAVCFQCIVSVCRLVSNNDTRQTQKFIYIKSTDNYNFIAMQPMIRIW